MPNEIRVGLVDGENTLAISSTIILIAVFSSSQPQVTADLHLAVGSDVELETCWSALGNKSRVVSRLVHGLTFDG